MRIIGGLGVVDNYEMKDEMKRDEYRESSNESSIMRVIESTTFWQRKLRI